MKNKITSAKVAQTPAEKLSDCYSLGEFSKLSGCSELLLFELAVKNKIVICVPAADWKIEWGIYLDDGETEITQGDVIDSTRLLPIRGTDVWRIFSDDSIQLEYFEKSASSFSKISKSNKGGLPKIDKIGLTQNSP